MRFIQFLLILCTAVSPLLSQTRSFDEIFPNLPLPVREAVFSNEGYSMSFERISPPALVGSTQDSIDPQIIESLFRKQPRFVVESIRVIPDSTSEHTLLDVYNALGKTRSLAGRLYRSHTRNENVPLFEEVTRIESTRRNTAIADPPPASAIPPSETVYMRLKDVNFGNSFYRGDMTLSRYGLRYSLTNFRNLTYLMVPVIREEKFSAHLYFEPVSEGILIYGLAGADVSDFVSSRIGMKSAISKRLAVILSWVTDGIKEKS
jgi:hypothetical protein